MLTFEQPRHLARMRRDDHVDTVAPVEAVGIAGERIERVGVENERHAGAFEQCRARMRDVRWRLARAPDRRQ